MNDVVRKVAAAWLRRTAKYGPEFLKHVQGRKFRNPESENQVVFHSLPPKEQARIHAQYWQSRAQQPQGPGLRDTGEETWSGGKVYRADVEHDTFVHFTPQSRAQQIIESGKLLTDPPHKKFGIEGVQAVSLGYGDYTPEVQTTHTKTDEKDPLVAVVFRTQTSPSHGYIEEVQWDQDVALHEPRIVSSEEAQKMMKESPHKITGDDMVVYQDRKKTAKYNPEFLRWTGQQRFVQPNTRNRVKFESLEDEEQKKIYDRWNSMTHGEEAERTQQANRWLVPNSNPKRYDHIKFQIRLDEKTEKDDKERLTQVFGTEDDKEMRDKMLDLSGLGGIADMVASVDVLTWEEGDEVRVHIAGRGSDGLHFERQLIYEETGDEDQPYMPRTIQNNLFSVGRQAPSGVGTKMLASQVGAAEQEGFGIIETEATRGGDMNGYYTWPRLGFNAGLTAEDMDDLEDHDPEAAWEVRQLAEIDSNREFLGDSPAELFHVMAIPAARAWWEREGHTIPAFFSVSEDYDGGKAYQLLRAYTEAKAMAEGKTIPEYLSKTAGKKGKNMAPHLDKQDNEILDRVWDDVRKRLQANVKKKKASALARFWLWTKIVKSSLGI